MDGVTSTPPSSLSGTGGACTPSRPSPSPSQLLSAVMASPLTDDFVILSPPELASLYHTCALSFLRMLVIAVTQKEGGNSVGRLDPPFDVLGFLCTTSLLRDETSQKIQSKRLGDMEKMENQASILAPRLRISRAANDSDPTREGATHKCCPLMPTRRKDHH